MKKIFYIFFITLLANNALVSQEHTVARIWVEELLNAIRNDFARPTVHARNLWHHSILMYDLWAVYDGQADTYFLGKTHGNFTCEFEGIPPTETPEEDLEEAISYAMYRLLFHRFQFSPKATATLVSAVEQMQALGYLISNAGTDYQSGDPAALGNYIAEQMIAFGLQDGSNELEEYGNRFYEPVNPPLAPKSPGNPDIIDPNHWQPLAFDVFIDQSGNPRPGNEIEFLSPEWGDVLHFALNEDDLTQYDTNGVVYNVWHDPGSPPLLGTDDVEPYFSTEYKLGFIQVAIWASHLDQNDGVLWDISPGAMGNNMSYPEMYTQYAFHYDFFEGGERGTGRAMNPFTGEPYAPNMVPRGDFTRVLAEFWADGPNSETPPGHWYTITNYVNDHPELVKKYQGQGEVLDDLEWDVKIYFALGGALHDAAVSAWSIKGYYDFIRPISAIRYMASKGQSSNTSLDNYHPDGIILFPGFIEVVESGDPLAGNNNQHVGKIKLRTWKGPDYIEDPEVDQAGVGWILADNWWPYQRPTFVTPPFAGYVSGHSTFSRAAAELLTRFTGSEYFPGGVGEFIAKKDSFLVFEEGPSQDIVLQWATYRDASDQTSLSRIWGGIHPPADDIPGRLIGIEIGNDAFDLADEIFQGEPTLVQPVATALPLTIYPNMIRPSQVFHIGLPYQKGNEIALYNINGKLIEHTTQTNGQFMDIQIQESVAPGLYTVLLRNNEKLYTGKIMVQ